MIYLLVGLMCRGLIVFVGGFGNLKNIFWLLLMVSYDHRPHLQIQLHDVVTKRVILCFVYVCNGVSRSQ